MIQGKHGRTKLISLFLVVVMTALMLCACGQKNSYVPQLTLSEDMPPERSVFGDYVDSFTTMLYFLSEDGRNLSGEEREIICTDGMSRAEATVNALLIGPESTLLKSTIPPELLLDRIEISSTVCNVYFTGNFSVDIDAWLTVRASLAATLEKVENTRYVNVYVNEMEPGYHTMPLGTQESINESLDEFILNMMQEYEVTPSQESILQTMSKQRNATIYVPDMQTGLLAATNVELVYPLKKDNAEICTLLIDELNKHMGSEADTEPSHKVFVTAKPTEITVIEKEAVNDVVEPQTHTIIDVTLYDWTTDYDEELLCGALTLTLSGYIPDVSGVRVTFVNPEGEERTANGGNEYMRKQFSKRIGHNIELVYPDQSGVTFVKEKRLICYSDIYDPLVRIEALFDGETVKGISHPVFTSEDIEAVYRIHDLVVINWREGFSEKLIQYMNTDTSLLPIEEYNAKMFVYSVINTLGQMQGVNRVWMIENGEKITSDFNGEIYLGNALLKNPGIMVEG